MTTTTHHTDTGCIICISDRYDCQDHPDDQPRAANRHQPGDIPTDIPPARFTGETMTRPKGQLPL